MTPAGRALFAGGLFLGVDAVPGGHADVPVPGGAGDDDLPQGDVVGLGDLVEQVLGVGDDLDVVGPVGQAGDVERLPGLELAIEVAPADRHVLLHPQRAGLAAQA